MNNCIITVISNLNPHGEPIGNCRCIIDLYTQKTGPLSLKLPTYVFEIFEEDADNYDDDPLSVHTKEQFCGER